MDRQAVWTARDMPAHHLAHRALSRPVGGARQCAGVRVDPRFARTRAPPFASDMAANADTLDASSERRPWATKLDGATGGGVIRYGVDGPQRVAFVAGTRSPIDPVEMKTGKVVALALRE
jgi:hypothetical protein